MPNDPEKEMQATRKKGLVRTAATDFTIGNPPTTVDPDHVDFNGWDQPAFMRIFKFDSGEELTATWSKPTVEQGAGNKHEDAYVCKLSQSKVPTKPIGYSLFTIGIQGRKHAVRVKLEKTDSSRVVLTPGMDEPIGNVGQGEYRIPPTGYVVGSSGKQPVAPGGVGFIWFDGTYCILRLRSERVQHAKRLPGFQVQHGTEPPPPGSGGEDGDQQP